MSNTMRTDARGPSFEKGQTTKRQRRLNEILANWTAMVERNPAFRQKAPGIRGGVLGRSPTIFFIVFIFFL
jgi:hypothetical protein